MDIVYDVLCILEQSTNVSPTDVKTSKYFKNIVLLPLRTKKVVETFYDKELGMHFESARSFNPYEIEIKNIHLDLDKEIRKSTDFQRRLGYKYDWLQVEKCSDGTINDVGNIEELRNNWNKLKTRIQKDYVGSVVEQYLQKITEKLDDKNHFQNIFHQYNEFGLLFAPIPQNHNKNWEHRRIVQVDNNEETKLSEIITLENETEKTRTYNLTWEPIPSEKMLTLKKGEGKLEYCMKQHLIKRVYVDIIYHFDNSINNCWKFDINLTDNTK